MLKKKVKMLKSYHHYTLDKFYMVRFSPLKDGLSIVRQLRSTGQNHVEQDVKSDIQEICFPIDSANPIR